jgi:hypothetical protein
MSQFNKSVLVFKHRQLLIKSWVIKFSIILILKLIFDSQMITVDDELCCVHQMGKGGLFNDD